MSLEWKYIDANERSILYPATFEVPCMHMLQSVKPGWFVKVGVEFDDGEGDDETGWNGERFWTEVVSVDDGVIIGRVDNNLLVKDHGIEYGDLLEFSFSNILEVLPPTEDVAEAI